MISPDKRARTLDSVCSGHREFGLVLRDKKGTWGNRPASLRPYDSYSYWDQQNKFKRALDYSDYTDLVSFPFKFLYGSLVSYVKGKKAVPLPKLVASDLGLGWLLSWIPGTPAFRARQEYANFVVGFDQTLKAELTKIHDEIIQTQGKNCEKSRELAYVISTLYPSPTRIFGRIAGFSVAAMASLSVMLFGIGGLIVAGVVPQALAATVVGQLLVTAFTSILAATVPLIPFMPAVISVALLAVIVGVSAWFFALFVREMLSPSKSRIVKAVKDFRARVTRKCHLSFGQVAKEALFFPLSALYTLLIHETRQNPFRYAITVLKFINTTINSFIDLVPTGGFYPLKIFKMILRGIITLPFIIVEVPLKLLMPVGDLIGWAIRKAFDIVNYVGLIAADAIAVTLALATTIGTAAVGLIVVPVYAVAYFVRNRFDLGTAVQDTFPSKDNVDADERLDQQLLNKLFPGDTTNFAMNRAPNSGRQSAPLIPLIPLVPISSAMSSALNSGKQSAPVVPGIVDAVSAAGDDDDSGPSPSQSTGHHSVG